MDKLNDKNVIAYYNPDGQPRTVMFDFQGLPPGSGMRCARVAEYDRLIEALKGQGCDVHVWGIHYWQRVRESFWAGKQRSKNT